MIGDGEPRDHGGNLDDARARHGGEAADWLDLSTGINPCPWPVEDIHPETWARLPDRGAVAAVEAAARAVYGVAPDAGLVAVPGLSAAIRVLPRLQQPGRMGEVAIPSPTYNEHAAAWADEGWRVVARPGPATRATVIVNPNNPDGRLWERHEVLTLAEALPMLVVDESFADARRELSVADAAGPGSGLVVLRSFGKFYGLAGLRLGFVIGPPDATARVAAMLGPWAVSGPALEIGRRALEDTGWAARTRRRLARDMVRLKALGRGAGWSLVGEGSLFATFETGDAAGWQERLAEGRIWSRIFPWSAGWLRLGLPGDEAGWVRLARALGSAG